MSGFRPLPRGIGRIAFAGCLIAAVAAADTAEEYRIGPRDLLAVTVFEVPSLNLSVRVDSDGRVNLPLLGSLEVQGLTAGEVAERLQRFLEEKYVQRATVSVRIEEHMSRSVTLIGAVQKPGPIGLAGRLTLLDAILQAGNLRDDHGPIVQVRRRAANGLTDQIEVPVDQLVYNVDPRVNLPLAPNDLVNVPLASKVTVYILGQIANPGPIVFESGQSPSLLAAIARAGGLSDRAANTLRIKRAAAKPNSPEAVVEVDYKQLLRARVEDLELFEGDVIVVKESFF